jgi:hypothetical protein
VDGPAGDTVRDVLEVDDDVLKLIRDRGGAVSTPARRASAYRLNLMRCEEI